VAHAKLHDGKIIFTASWSEKDLIKTIPGARWDPRDKMWTLPLSWSSLVISKGVFAGNLTYDEKLIEWGNEYFHDVVEPQLRRRLEVEPSGTDLADRDITDKRLFDFQLVGARFLATVSGTDSVDGVILADDMGTGKTVQALTALGLVTDSLPTLVICPNGTKYGWSDAAAEWSDAVPYVIDGGVQGRRKMFEAARKDPKALVIINYESVRTHSRLTGYGSIRLKRCIACDKKYGDPDLKPASCQVHPKELNTFPFKTVIIDEAHRIKDPDSQQTRAVWATTRNPTVRRAWAMTGTPIANSPVDIWSIYHAISPHNFPVRGSFIDRYALQSYNSWGGLDVVGLRPDTREEFYRIIDYRFRRMPKSLVLPQLPQKVWSQRAVDMTPKQRKAYNEMATGNLTYVDGVLMLARDDIIVHTRLMQLASSYGTVEWVPNPQPDNPELEKCVVTLTEPSPKLDALEEIHEELGGKQYVVTAPSRQLINMAMKRYDKKHIKYGFIVGGQHNMERRGFIKAFKAGDFQVMFVVLAAGGTGVDGLQVANSVVRLQRSWSMVDNLQGLDRNHRIGSTGEFVHIIDIYTRDTVEVDQFERLRQKEERLEQINRDRATLAYHGALDTEEFEIAGSWLGEP
jgi:SNF2 family DNA or RNA helicase